MQTQACVASQVVVLPQEGGAVCHPGGRAPGPRVTPILTDVLPSVLSQSKNNRPLRTGQMYAQDENATHTQLYTSHFDLMKMTAGKRSPPIKPLYAPQVPLPAPRGGAGERPAVVSSSRGW